MLIEMTFSINKFHFGICLIDDIRCLIHEITRNASYGPGPGGGLGDGGGG